MKRLFLLTFAVLLFGVTGMVGAQADGLCGDLPEADCAILQKNLLATPTLDSYYVDMFMDLTIDGLPDLPPGAQTFSFLANGAVSGNAGIPTETPEEQIARSSDPQANADYMAALFDQLEMELQMRLVMPPAMVRLLALDIEPEIPLNIALVDGIFYMDMTSLRDALGRDGRSLPSGWYGVDMGELMALSAAMNETPGSSVTADDLDPALLERINEAASDLDVVEVERIEDTVDTTGATVANFYSTYDFGPLMALDGIDELIDEALALQGTPMTRREREQVMLAISALLDNMTLEVITSVGLDNYYTRRTRFIMHVDLQPMMQAVDPRSRSQSQTPMSFTLDMTMSQSGFNEVDAILPPRNATIIPLDAFGLPGTGREQAKMPVA